jgi:hypothetical protein
VTAQRDGANRIVDGRSCGPRQVPRLSAGVLRPFNDARRPETGSVPPSLGIDLHRAPMTAHGPSRKPPWPPAGSAVWGRPAAGADIKSEKMMQRSKVSVDLRNKFAVEDSSLMMLHGRSFDPAHAPHPLISETF